MWAFVRPSLWLADFGETFFNWTLAAIPARIRKNTRWRVMIN
jgi:hypothetical protein